MTEAAPLQDAQKQEDTTEEPAVAGIASAYVEESSLVLDPSLLDKSLVERMPNPTGWRLLVMPYRGKGVTEGGIILTDKTRDENQIATVCAYVLKVGPLAYKDEKKFPSGAWCEAGQWVLFPRYAGSRFKLDDGGEVRILNDDEIIGTIFHPDDIVSL